MSSSELDIKQIIAILQRQRRLIVLTLAVVIGIAFVYLLAATPVYRATVLLQIESGGSNLLDPSTGETQQSAVVNSRVDSEVEILQSEATALAVIQNANLLTDPEFGPAIGLGEKLGRALGIDSLTAQIRRMLGFTAAETESGAELINNSMSKLREATDVRRRGLTYLIAVSISSESPQRAASIANSFASTYIERQVQSKTSTTVAARDVLRRQIAIAQQELADSETRLNAFIEDNLNRLETESGDAGVAALRSQLEQAQQDRRASTVRVASAEAAIGAGNWQDLAQTLSDEALAELARQREALEKRLSTEVVGSTASVDLQAALTAIDRDLQDRSTAVLSELKGNVDGISQLEQQTRDKLRATLLQSDLSSEMITGLFSLQQSTTIARNQYQQLLSREQDLGAMVNLQIADARIVSEALAPAKAAFPNKRLILMVSVVAALGIGIGLAFLNEYYIGGITSPSQLRNVMQTKVPVAVPSMSLQLDGTGLADQVVTAPLSVYAETFRKLRSAVDIALRGLVSETRDDAPNHGKCRIVLVCSALPAEGKSTTALALARTYALSGMNTLLIDADLRKPALARYTGVESEIGLLEYLSPTERSDAPTIQFVYDPLSRLALITAGGRSSQPTDQMLNSQAFRSLLQVASDAYDIIVIDSPPLLPVVDTRYLAQYADVVVQVVRHASTTQGEVREATHLVQEMIRPGVQMLGILSHQQGSIGGGGYYEGQYSGYYGDDA